METILYIVIALAFALRDLARGKIRNFGRIRKHELAIAIAKLEARSICG